MLEVGDEKADEPVIDEVCAKTELADDTILL